MSWNILKIGERNAVKKSVQEDPYLPDSVKAVVNATINDTLPEHSKNWNGVSVEGYGHQNNDDGSALSNFKLEVKPIQLILGVIVMLLLAVSLVGCKTPAQTVAFNTISSVDTAAKAAIDGYFQAVAKGQASTNNVPAISKAYMDVEAGCQSAALFAQNGTNALAPAALTQELGSLLALTSTIVTNK